MSVHIKFYTKHPGMGAMWIINLFIQIAGKIQMRVLKARTYHDCIKTLIMVRLCYGYDTLFSVVHFK